MSMSRKFIGWVSSPPHKKFYFFGIPIIKKFNPEDLLATIGSLNNQLKEVLAEFSSIKNNYIPALINHPAVFEKYKGCNKGKDVIIVALGPTMDKYVPIPGAVHMGLNHAFRRGDIELDYLIMQDYFTDIDEEVINYRPGKCKKLFGMHYKVTPISERLLERCQAERFYIEVASPWNGNKRLPVDIAHQPFLAFSSVVIPTATFALYTRPRRIYLVGCDCSDRGHAGVAKGIPRAHGLYVKGILKGWEVFAQYAKDLYPDVEIVSINPMGLKGMFRDIYTGTPEYDALLEGKDLN